MRRRLLPIMTMRVLVLLLAQCAARPAPPRSLTLTGGAKKKAIKHGQCITPSTRDSLIYAQASATRSTPSIWELRATLGTSL